LRVFGPVIELARHARAIASAAMWSAARPALPNLPRNKSIYLTFFGKLDKVSAKAYCPVIDRVPKELFMTEDKKPDTVMMFCGKSLKTFQQAGGCGDWKLDKDRAIRKRYVVAVRNHHAEWSEFDVPHGVAWFVGTVEDVVEAPGGRWLVKVGQYARINVRRDWGSRNPVAYIRLEELGVDPDKLDWKDFLDGDKQVDVGASTPVAPALGGIQPLTFDQAKQGLAAAMGIRPEQIEITIRA
jgi:hypothetical protein